MENVFVNFDWVGGFTSAITASCTIKGGPPEIKGRTIIFATEKKLAKALAGVGVPEHEYVGTINTLKSGFTTFLWLTLEQAQQLQMIERVE